MPSWRDGESEKRARCREQNEDTADPGGRQHLLPLRMRRRPCTCTIAMTPGEYATVRTYATHFAVTRNHENPESEQVIEENTRFAVVETVAGNATKLARGAIRASAGGRPAGRAAAGRAPETVPIENETTERVVRTVVLALPLAALVVGGWLAWGGALRWHDLVVLAITYTLTGLGITVGYHRLFTHRSFKTTRGGAGGAGGAGLDGRRGAGDRMGRHASQAPPVLRPGGRSAQPPRRPRPGVARHDARPGPRPRRLDVPRPGHGQPRALRQGPARATATCASSAARSRCGWRSGWPCPSGSGWR